MRDHVSPDPPYDPPSIEERTPIDMALIGAPLSGALTGSAAFRPVPAAPHEVPRIEERTPIDLPLIGGQSVNISAVFRSDQNAEES